MFELLKIVFVEAWNVTISVRSRIKNHKKTGLKLGRQCDVSSWKLNLNWIWNWVSVAKLSNYFLNTVTAKNLYTYFQIAEKRSIKHLITKLSCDIAKTSLFTKKRQRVDKEEMNKRVEPFQEYLHQMLKINFNRFKKPTVSYVNNFFWRF